MSFAVWAPNAKGVSLIGDFNQLGRQRGAAARAGLVRRLGVVLARLSRPTASTSSGSTAPTARSPTTPIRWPSPPRCRRRPRRGSAQQLHVARRTNGWPSGRIKQPGVRADEHLRGAPRLVAAGSVLSRAGRPAHRIRCRAGFHPCRDAARGRAPLRRVVGLPGHVVLRADVAVRHPRRLPLSWSTRCTRPASA